MQGRSRKWIWLGGGALTLLVTWAAVAPAHAIPAFARKYQTSCQTCHTAFPNLTPFGESFRLNGYRFPEGTDESVSKDDPVSLGAAGYKKLWPKSVWPGTIPGLPPISAVIEGEIANERADNITSFDGLGGEFALLAGGTFGEHISFYAELEFGRVDGETEVELERLNVGFRPLNTPAFQFKVGAFEPGVLLLSNHRRLTESRYFITTAKVGNNEWALEPLQQGVEIFGVAWHRLLYTAGYVEGAGNESNSRKDYYGRVAYKIGGLRLDGTTPEGGGTPPSAKPKPWSEKSLTFSVFGYRGNPTLSETSIVLMNDPITDIVSPVETTLDQLDPFTMYGGDLRWNFLDLIVHAGAASRTDERPFLDDPADMDVKTKTRFAEIDWVALPWLIPAARYETFNVAGDKTEQISLTVNFLVRANVKTFIAANRIREAEGDFETEEIVLGAAVGF